MGRVRPSFAPWTSAAAALALAACATTPAPQTPAAPPREAAPPTPPTAPVRPDAAPAETPFSLAPDRFAALPGWAAADHAPALTAFQRSCAGLRLRRSDAALPGGGRYGGVSADWTAACAAAASVAPADARAFFETWFIPHRVVGGGGQARLTGYFEPVFEARRSPEGPLSEPILRRPTDMVTIDLAAFAEALDNEALRGAPRRLTGQIAAGQVRPYPERARVRRAGGEAIAYAHPADVYSLQVQGSGRLRFPDGTQARAAFAAQNGYRWRSAVGQLQEAGRLPPGAGTWDRFRRFVDAAGPSETQAALNADPSYVFFIEEPLADPSLGPRGASGASLTALGSVAVDPAFHPYGAPLFIAADNAGEGFARLLVAQDTGGAIRRGPLRGDVFFGTGPEAGAAAERMNAAVSAVWTLLPAGSGGPAPTLAAP